MRIRKIFVASLLTMTFGCPGDDSGDTDANTTVNTTSGTPETTTGTPETTTTGTPETTTTGTPETSTTDEPADSSSGTPDDTSSGGGSDTGEVNEACATFCAAFMETCGDGPANDYGDEAGCMNACGLYDQKTFDCKEYHLSMADGPGSVHCTHANRDGNGVC